MGLLLLVFKYTLLDIAMFCEFEPNILLPKYLILFTIVQLIITCMCFVSVSYLYFYMRYLLQLVAVIEMSTELCHCKTFCAPWSKDSIKFSLVWSFPFKETFCLLICFHNSCKLVKRSVRSLNELKPSSDIIIGLKHRLKTLFSSVFNKRQFTKGNKLCLPTHAC